MRKMKAKEVLFFLFVHFGLSMSLWDKLQFPNYRNTDVRLRTELGRRRKGGSKNENF